jgi:hypothetical protein
MTPWTTYGQALPQMTKAGYSMEDHKLQYTTQDIRFTTKEVTLLKVDLAFSFWRL